MSSGDTQSFLPQQSWQRGNLNDPETKPWGIECAISDAIEKAERILEKIDERWPSNKVTPAQ